MFSQMLPSFLTSMNLSRALSYAALVAVLGLTFLAAGTLSRDGLPTTAEASPGYQPAYQEPAVMLPTLGNVELGVNDFIKSAPQGFGDAQNSVIWAMQWWNDKLYVGTNRSWMCWSFASIVEAFPFLGYLYPPRDPDIQCTDDPTDLPLQGEIWAWDPDLMSGNASSNRLKTCQSPAPTNLLRETLVSAPWPCSPNRMAPRPNAWGCCLPSSEIAS